MNTSRIRDLAKQQGKSVTYICKLIDRPKYYLNDVDKKPDRMISDEDLKTLAINLGTTAEYLKGETDDPLFHLSSVGLTTEPYEKNCKRPIFGHASAGKGVIAQQEAFHRRLIDLLVNSVTVWDEPDGYKITTAYNLTSCKTKTFRVEKNPAAEEATGFDFGESECTKMRKYEFCILSKYICD